MSLQSFLAFISYTHLTHGSRQFPSTVMTAALLCSVLISASELQRLANQKKRRVFGFWIVRWTKEASEDVTLGSICNI